MRLFDYAWFRMEQAVVPGVGFVRDLVGDLAHVGVRERAAHVKAQQPVVVDVSNVAAWLFEVDDRPDYPTGAFPSLAPPWSWTWFEYSMPRHVNESGVVERMDTAGFRVAVLQAAYERDGGGWSIVQDVYTTPGFSSELRPTYEGTMLAEVNADGTEGSGRYATAPKEVVDEHGGEYVQRNVSAYSNPVLMAMAFASCRNVQVVDNPVPPKVAKKREKAGKPPGVTYKTLVIDPMKETLRTEGGIAEHGLKKALHICRGHFATYTEDRPLFGHFVGTVWRPMHTRGSKDRGEVRKDYRVKAPE